MKLVITIDTEEDNWGSYDSQEYTLENIKNIPVLQELFDRFGVKPTYLITYPVAMHGGSLAILKEIKDSNRCEIGTHCHPWNTPPLEEEKTARNSMLCNLPPDLQYRKLNTLHEAIQKNFGTAPVSFRAGRWGYSKDVAKNISQLGYAVDTSVTPYTDWSSYHGPDFTGAAPAPYRFIPEDIFRASAAGRMIEIPATVGFLQSNFALSNTLLQRVSRSPFNKLHLVGILSRLYLLNKVWLSPEMSDAKSMIRVTRMMRKNRYPIVNMSFHSTSLKAGLSPFVKTDREERAFLERIRVYLEYAKNEGFEFSLLRDGLEPAHSHERDGMLTR